MFFICSQLAMPDFPGKVVKCVCSVCKKEVEHRVSLSLKSRPKGWAVVQIQDDEETKYLICSKCACSLLDVHKITFTTHSIKSVAEIRGAISWLKDHGFAGHFSHVPPEVLAETEEVDVDCTPYGFYFSTEGDVSLWAPMRLQDLTPELRQKIEEKYGMAPEEVIERERQKLREEMAKRRGPLLPEEADEAFEVTGNPGSEIAYMWPEVSPYALGGLCSEEFRHKITLVFSSRLNFPMMPYGKSVAFVAKPKVVKDLIRKLAVALKENLRERRKIEGKGDER